MFGGIGVVFGGIGIVPWGIVNVSWRDGTAEIVRETLEVHQTGTHGRHLNVWDHEWERNARRPLDPQQLVVGVELVGELGHGLGQPENEQVLEVVHLDAKLGAEVADHVDVCQLLARVAVTARLAAVAVSVFPAVAVPAVVLVGRSSLVEGGLLQHQSRRPFIAGLLVIVSGLVSRSVHLLAVRLLGLRLHVYVLTVNLYILVVNLVAVVSLLVGGVLLRSGQPQGQGYCLDERLGSGARVEGAQELQPHLVNDDPPHVEGCLLLQRVGREAALVRGGRGVGVVGHALLDEPLGALVQVAVVLLVGVVVEDLRQAVELRLFGLTGGMQQLAALVRLENSFQVVARQFFLHSRV